MELTDCVSMLVGNNERIQAIISQLEETCRAVDVSLNLANTCSGVTSPIDDVKSGWSLLIVYSVEHLGLLKLTSSWIIIIVMIVITIILFS